MKNFLLLLCFALICYFAYDKYVALQQPKEVRLIQSVTSESTPTPKTTSTPEPTPSPEPTPIPPTTPEPTPALTPTPEPTPTEEEKALDWLRNNPSGQPQTVTLLLEREFPLLMDGRAIGKSKVPAGTSGRLVSWDDDNVNAVFAGGERQLEWIETDFVARVLKNYRTSKDQPQIYWDAGNDQRATEKAEVASTVSSFDLNKEITATALAEYCKANRSAFSSLKGSPVKVQGIVDVIKLVGSNIGTGTIAEVSLRTAPNLPKVRLLIHPSDFLSNEGAYDRIEMRINNNALEFRIRDNRAWADYYYWYYYNGYWQKRSTPKTEWSRVLYVGAPVNAVGVLSKFLIHIDLEGARINKDIAIAQPH